MDSSLAQEVQTLVDDAIKKASVTTSTYTFTPPQRSIFSPENLMSTIQVLVPMTSPVRDALPRTEGFGQAAGWNRLVSTLDNTASGTNTDIGFADGGQPNQTTQTYTFVSQAYKNLGRDVEIGRQQIAANRGGNLEDIRNQQEKIKATEVMLGEEVMIMHGESASSSVDFDGLDIQLTTNINYLYLNSYLTISGVGQQCQVQYLKGADNIDLLIANPRQQQALGDNLQATGSIQRIVQSDQNGTTGGLRLTHLVNPVQGTDIALLASRYAYAAAYLLQTASIAGDPGVEMEDLEQMSVYDVPTADHSIVSRVYESAVLKVIAEPFCGRFSGLLLS
jgi:hypothetical protein